MVTPQDFVHRLKSLSYQLPHKTPLLTLSGKGLSSVQKRFRLNRPTQKLRRLKC